MNNDNIALNFDKAEYYSLEEASEYLNRKYKTDNINAHKLLKKVVQYEIPLFIYGKNFQLTGDYVMKSFRSVEPINDDMELYRNNLKEVSKLNRAAYSKIDSMLSAVMENTGGFLELSVETIRAFLFDSKITTDNIDETSLFGGFLPIAIPNSNASSLDYLDDYLLSYFEDSVAFTLALYPSIDIFLDDEEDITSAIDRTIKSCTPKVVDYYLYDKENEKTYITPYFEISRNDLVVLSSGVTKLEELISNNEETSIEIKSLDTDFLKQKGVSPQKLLAKHMAKHIANKEWQTDVQNKIKITEMSEIIYSKLYSLGFNNELPDQARNIKSWIKEVAPDYASEGGRPPSL
ncbi:hypothetical protein [Psychrobacter aquimaris]|uniref:hypothetical protein n=1 Tax=Psychrobacter aquimaris TaxID=292733 RepID=UPI0039C70692